MVQIPSQDMETLWPLHQHRQSLACVEPPSEGLVETVPSEVDTYLVIILQLPDEVFPVGGVVVDTVEAVHARVGLDPLDIWGHRCLSCKCTIVDEL